MITYPNQQEALEAAEDERQALENHGFYTEMTVEELGSGECTVFLEIWSDDYPERTGYYL